LSFYNYGITVPDVWKVTAMAGAARDLEQRQHRLADAGLDALWQFAGIADASLVATGAPVTITQFRVLTMISRHGPMPLTNLARLVGVAPSTATRMCDRLVRDKLLARRASTEDRRVVTLSLTARGLKIVRDVTAWRREALMERFATIDPERWAALADALEECAAALAPLGIAP